MTDIRPDSHRPNELSAARFSALERQSRDNELLRGGITRFHDARLKGLGVIESPHLESPFRDLLNQASKLLYSPSEIHPVLRSSLGFVGWNEYDEEVLQLAVFPRDEAGNPALPWAGKFEALESGAFAFLVTSIPSRGFLSEEIGESVFYTPGAVTNSLRHLKEIDFLGFDYGVPSDYPHLLSRAVDEIRIDMALPIISVSDLHDGAEIDPEAGRLVLETAYGTYSFLFRADPITFQLRCDIEAV